MVAILKFSGAHWARSALVWFVLLALVDGLADPAAEAADGPAQAIPGSIARPNNEADASHAHMGRYQIAKIEVVDLDVNAVAAASFGDTDEPVAAKP